MNHVGLPKSSLSSAGDFISIPERVVVGTDEVEYLLTTAHRLTTEQLVTSVSCGGNHNLALTQSNSVYTWGYGDMLALGHGNEKDERVPRKLNFASKGSRDHISTITVTQVSGGGQHSAVIGKVAKL